MNCKMIPQSFIQELLNRVDIVEVVERCVPLKKAGANYQACCPFHTEKTPSFTVSPSKQFYHCFGCGAHGSAVGFVMEYRGLNFVEAVKELAAASGMTVPETHDPGPRTQSKEGVDLYAVMQEATRYYRGEIKKSERAIAYLKNRGLSGEIAARFGIGYAPAGWQNLAAEFSDYTSSALVETGLVVQGDDGRRYDRFRDRIMFPIVNPRGMIVGFGGRVLDQGEPKYLNSPETPLFEKGREVYGLYQARRAIREAGKVLVVEGYMDVVGLAQHGIEYAVATLGTATTPFHVQKLLKQTDEVIYCFDGDEAGRRAAWRALENSLGQLVDGKHVGFLFLPEGEDPDTYIRKFGKPAFENLLGQVIPLSSFLLKELTSRVDLATTEGRAQLLKDARPLVTQVAAPMLSLLLRKRLSELAGIGQGELDAIYQIQSVAPSRGIPDSRRQMVLSNWKTILRCLVFRPDLAQLCGDLELPGGGEPEVKAVTALLEFLTQESGAGSTSLVIQHFSKTPHEELFRRVEQEILKWDEAFEVEADLRGAIAKITAAQDHRRASIIWQNQPHPAQLSPEDRERVRYGGKRPVAAEK